MTRAQFLNELYHRLEGLTPEQAEQHLTYYAEMLADRMEEGMSEEEAVAGMEDLDTIARRILEEEGLPAPAAPAAEKPVTPPAYPDASRIPGGGGKKGYQAPRKRDWRKRASVLLWVLAILCVVGAVGRRLARLGSSDSTTSVYEVDVVEETPPDVAQPQMEYSLDPGAAEFFLVPADEVSGIFVDWISGAVEVECWDGGEIRFTADDERRLGWELTGGVLSISSSPGETLYLQIPSGLLDCLDIRTSSADVAVHSTDIAALQISTASGRAVVGDLHADSATVSTVSGDIFFDGLYSDYLDFSTSSGDVYGMVYCPYFNGKTVSGDVEMEVLETGMVYADTTSGGMALSLEDSLDYAELRSQSGDIELSLPDWLGFTLRYDTISGEADINVECRRSNGVYSRGDGECTIGVTTTSGDLSVADW